MEEGVTMGPVAPAAPAAAAGSAQSSCEGWRRPSKLRLAQAPCAVRGDDTGDSDDADCGFRIRRGRLVGEAAGSTRATVVAALAALGLDDKAAEAAAALEDDDANAVVDSRRAKLKPDQKAVFMAWVRGHMDNPYPSLEEKAALAAQAGTSVERTTTFFINFRARQWSTMAGGSGTSGGSTGVHGIGVGSASSGDAHAAVAAVASAVRGPFVHRRSAPSSRVE
jgi:hypothetical protein